MAVPQYHLEGIVHTKTDQREDFEGPLDVIFLLLSKNKIEIQDVSISAILEQYLAYLEERKRLDMEIASEFIAMASHLMLIKTKMLLSQAEREEAESELDLLRQGLAQRQRREAMEQIRTAISYLEPRNDIGRCQFVKEAEPLRRDEAYRYRHPLSDLAAGAFRGLVGKEPYPVTKKAGEVLRVLILRGVERLRSLFLGSRSRSEVVATFLAILELCRQRKVTVEDGAGDEPEVRINPGSEEESV